MIKSVWIEIRPGLSCCHVCIVFKKKLNSAVKIKINKSELMLEVYEKSFHVQFKDFIVEPLTMTGFKIINQYLIFRIQVESKLNIKSFSPSKLNPLDFGGEKFGFICHCLNLLTEKIIFKKILPLPLNDLNPADLFCHVQENSFLDNNTLEPKLTDCFYSDHLIMVNANLVLGCIKRGKFLKCKRCLASVGVKHKNYVHLWLSSLMLPNDQYTPLKQLKNTIKKAISEPFSIFPHILFESEEINGYLSIIIVDKNLIVSSCQHNLDLKSSQVVKLKYTFYTSFDNEIKSLKSDPFNTLHHINVEKTFLNFSLNYLIASSKKIPPVFNKIDNTYMAYINLNE